MTDGSSQGLFVIVAVVIFGIFVAISYLIFSNNLKPSLASIFKDTTIQAKESLYPFSKMTNIKEIDALTGKIEIISTKDVFDFNVNPEDFSGISNLHYLGVSTYDFIEIPWNHKILFSYEVMHNGNSKVRTAFDYNSFFKNGISDSFSGNDNYGSRKDSLQADVYTEPNEWNRVDGWYSNNSIKNTKKETLYEGAHGAGSYGTTVGVNRRDAEEYGVTNIKIRNFSYKVVPIK